MNKKEKSVVMTTLGKTWLLDIDGTIVKHNGYKIDGEDCLLSGINKMFSQIDSQDIVVLLTSRGEEYREQTELFLKKNNVRYNYIIFGLPYGERILINDKKPSGAKMAFAINSERDHAYELNIIRDSEM